MTDRVLITNQKTGAVEIRQLGYMLPYYDIGDVLAYKVPKTDKDEHKEDKFMESEVVGIQADIRLLGQEVVTAYIYELADGTEIMEEEVEYYYDGGYDLEEQEEIMEDERDPQDSGAV